MVATCLRRSQPYTLGAQAVTRLVPSLAEVTLTQVWPRSTETSSLAVGVPQVSRRYDRDVLVMA